MCKFFSMVVGRTGEVYHLGVITAHEKVIEHFKLKDGDKSLIARVELSPKVEGEYQRPVNTKNWKFRIDESETPAWWNPEMESKCWKTLAAWMASADGHDFKTKYKKLIIWQKNMLKLNGEQLVFAEKLTPTIKKLILSYYTKGGSRYWDSVRGSVRGSVWDSVWDSFWDSVWDSVRDSVWDSVRDSVRDSVWDSVRGSFWGSFWGSVLYSLGSYLGNADAIKLKLPADIFSKGVVHAKINDEIWVWGLKGKLLGKIPAPKKELLA